MEKGAREHLEKDESAKNEVEESKDNLEEKVEKGAEEHIDSFSRFLENDEATAHKVEESKEDGENDEIDIDEPNLKEEGKYVTLLRDDGVEKILSRYSELLVQKRPKEENRILEESESGKPKRFPIKTLPQLKHRSQHPVITVDQVSLNPFLFEDRIFTIFFFSCGTVLYIM